MSLSSNSYVLQCDGKKWGSLRSELQLFFFLIEVSDFPQPHTCVKQMIMLLESFTVTLLRWIWAALSHHANVAAQKKKKLSPSSLGRTIFLQHYKERLPVTEWFNSSLVNVNSAFTIAVTVIIICFRYNTMFNMILSIARPSCGLQCHYAAMVRLIGTHHHYWTVSTVT